MPAVLFSVLLMSFILWAYSSINKSLHASNGGIEQQTVAKSRFSFIKILGITIALFLGCFMFISFTLQVNKTIEQEQTINNSNANESGDIFVNANPDAYKSLLQDKVSKEIVIIPAGKINTKFSDVAGLHEAKDEMQDIIKFLRDPVKFGRLGAKSPKGVLLYGQPGTGKTLLARAIAGETNVAFIAVSGSEFEQEFVGVGAEKVRQLFEVARKNSPCIIFIDEIDTLAHKRHSHDPGWLSQTVNQLLAEMDGLDNLRNQGIVVIGATNSVEAMDPAVLRPGRLDRHIKLDIPTLNEREEVLNIYLKKIKTTKDVKVPVLAKLTPGFSSAELANLVNEAAILATKQNKSAVDSQDFDAAKDRIILGSKREALKITDKARRITAYHEAGHALVGVLLGANHNPIYKVTITPRGPSLGHTAFELNDEEYSLNLDQIESQIAMGLAGRAAEELILGEQNITTGAESDLQKVTQLAFNMVTRWGYSKRIGPIYYGKSMDFIPKEVIEQEIRSIISRNYNRAKSLLIANRSKLDGLAKALLEKETLDAKQIKAILGAGK